MPYRKMVTDIQKQKAKDLYRLCQNGKAPNMQVKAELITLYNDIYKTKYKTTTNCGSCVSTVFKAIKTIALSDN
jgi:hypothetical protein